MSLVKTEREKRGITQAEAARRAQMPRSRLCKIETGKRKLAVEEVAPLARAIGCKPLALIPDLSDPDAEGEEAVHV